MVVKFIEGDDKVREKKCAEAVNEILKSFDCFMQPVLTLSTPGVVNAQVAIKAIPRGPEMTPEMKKAAQEAMEKAAADKKPMGPRG